MMETKIQSFKGFLDLFPSKQHKLNEKSWNVICPAHNDREPSLTVSINDNKILLYCQAGCTQEAILKAKNLNMSDLFLDNKLSSPRKIITTYDYQDAIGKVIYQVLRYEPKEFSVRRPDGKGNYITGLGDVPKVLYNLPQVLEGIKNNQTIYIVEGEKDADRLIKEGLIATTNPFGTGKWLHSYSECLRGARVILLPHNDSPGIAHMREAASNLKDIAQSLKWLEFEGIPTGGDVSDWLDKGGTIEALTEWAKEEPEYVPQMSPNMSPKEAKYTPPNVNDDNSIYNILNRERADFSGKNENSFVARQVTGQVQDKSRGYGELSEAFDNFLRDNIEPHWKRDVAEYIGTTYKDESFQKLVLRRRTDGMIRITHGGDKIQWINKDWQKSKIPLEAGKREFLGLSLPFGAEKYIATPEHSQIVVAGDVGSGKTHWGYLIADLNVGKIPIRHFVNEIGDQKAIRNLDDFPFLHSHFDNGYDLVNQDKEGLDVAENLDPNGLNIYDYLHLPSSKEWFLWLQKELARLSQKLESGAVVVMLQKKRGVDLAMGGDSTRMQCETYFALNIVKDIIGDENTHGYKDCRIDIIKCKDWATKLNPEALSCRYYTAPKYGKLVAYSEGWKRKES